MFPLRGSNVQQKRTQMHLHYGLAHFEFDLEEAIYNLQSAEL